MKRFRKVKVFNKWIIAFHPSEWMFAVFPNDEFVVAVVFCGPISVWRI